MSSNTREDRPSGKLEDCVRAFEVCAARGIDLILVGGQACHFYAWRYVEESPFFPSGIESSPVEGSDSAPALRLSYG